LPQGLAVDEIKRPKSALREPEEIGPDLTIHAIQAGTEHHLHGGFSVG
jgi:hypothetical protein